MCAYNRVDGDFACENDWLLNRVLKGDFAYPGYVMSDWGAVHSTAKAAINGLDQQSGWPFDEKPYFGSLLKQAVAAGQVPQARLDRFAEAEPRTGGNRDRQQQHEFLVEQQQEERVDQRMDDPYRSFRRSRRSVVSSPVPSWFGSMRASSTM